MADTQQTPQTQIAQELQRIKDAKDILGQKAETMGLVYVNPEDDDDRKVVTAADPINEIAVVYQDIDVYTQEDAEHTGHSINGKTVTLSEGFYTQQSMSVQEGTVSPPDITVSESTGEIIATVAVTEGYVSRGSVRTMDITDLEADLVGENIKSGVRMFNVAGTFTSDANVPTTNDGDEFKSDHISEGFTAYKNGKRVTGTMTNIDTAEEDYTFNPLVDNSYDVCTSPTRYRSLTIGISNDLLTALQAI